MSKVIEIYGSEYILPKGFDPDDDDNLMHPLQRVGGVNNFSITYFHYLSSEGTLQVKHTSKKFEHLWFDEFDSSGMYPALFYCLENDCDFLILLGLLDYPSIVLKLYNLDGMYMSLVSIIFDIFCLTFRDHLEYFLNKLNETQAHVKVDKIHSGKPYYPSFMTYLAALLDLENFSVIYPDMLDFIHRDDTISSTVTGEHYLIRAHGEVTSSYFNLPDNVSVIMLTSTGKVSIFSNSSDKYSGTRDTLLNSMNMLDYAKNLRLYEGGDLVENVSLKFNAQIFVGIKLVKDADREVVNEFEDDLNILGDDRDLTLFDIIQRLKSSLDLKSMNFKLILSSCRVRRKGAQEFRDICQLVKDIKHKTKWGQVCNPQEDRPMTHGKTSLSQELITLGDDIEFAIESIRAVKKPVGVSAMIWTMKSRGFPTIIKDLEKMLVKYLEGELIQSTEIVNMYNLISTYEDKTVAVEELNVREMIQRHVDPSLSLAPPSRRSPTQLP
jgi:hypothetical protein